MTDRERFAAAMAIVDRALDATTGEREAILATCTDDAVRAEARRLLAADAAAGDFLEAPAVVASAVDMLVQPSRAAAGDRVGAFELVSLLGRGGMGEVWVATRVGADFEQRVALKLLPVPGDDDAAARFRRERRILARLEHPGIAKLLDGGVTADGRPWLAMELVDGHHLTAHCSELDIDARLRLFAEICDVVQFAHRNLVVHRDLKPSNIVVAADGKPKLLDFGIAKLLASSDDEADLTRTRERPMTLEYAAPEQLRGDEITIASDVWALGVILHELLVGVRPFVAKSRAETEAAILAAAPVRPSSRVQTGGPPSATARRLRGDLDAIVLKALRPDPNARYPSAEALGTDVRRYLSRAPVAARGDATSYLFRAMVSRHRAAFAVAGLAIALLVAGIVGTLWQAHRARVQASKAERTREYLVEMVRGFDPDQVGGKPLTQREILEHGEARLGELDDDPEDQARLLEVFADVWYWQRDERHGLPLAVRAVALERGLDPRGLGLAKALDLEGNLEFNLTDYSASKQHFEEALEIATDREGDHGLTVALVLDDLAGVARKQTDYGRAEALRRRSLAIYKARLGDRARETISVEQNLAVLVGDEGRTEEALELQTQACKAMREQRGATHPDTLTCLANMGHDEVLLHRYAEAIATLDRVLADETATYGADWPDLSGPLLHRAEALDGLGRYPEAIAACENAIARETKHFGPDHAEVGAMYVRESLVLRHAGRATDAETAARHALAICEPKLGVTSACAGRARSSLGSTLLVEGRTIEARDELTRALAIEVTAFGAEHPETRSTRAELEKTN